MPATRPVKAESTDDTDSTTSTSSGTPFSIKYDKLIIAVGAYAQSKSNSLSCLSVSWLSRQLSTCLAWKNMLTFWRTSRMLGKYAAESSNVSAYILPRIQNNGENLWNRFWASEPASFDGHTTKKSVTLLYRRHVTQHTRIFSFITHLPRWRTHWRRIFCRTSWSPSWRDQNTLPSPWKTG